MIDAIRIFKLGGYMAAADVRALRQVCKATHDYVGIERTRLQLVGPSVPPMAWQAAFLSNVVAAGVPAWDLELLAIPELNPCTPCTLSNDVQILTRLVEFVRPASGHPPDAEACWRLAQSKLVLAFRSEHTPASACELVDVLWLCLRAAELLGCDDPSLLRAAHAMAATKVAPDMTCRAALEAAVDALAPMLHYGSPCRRIGAIGIDMTRVKCTPAAMHVLVGLLAESAGEVRRIVEPWSTPRHFWDIIAELFPSITDVCTSALWVPNLSKCPLASKIEMLTVKGTCFLPELPRELPAFSGLRRLSMSSLHARHSYEEGNLEGDFVAPPSLQHVNIEEVGGAWDNVLVMQYLLRARAYTKTMTIQHLHITSCCTDVVDGMVELLRRLPPDIRLCIKCVTIGKRSPVDALKVVAACSPSLATVHLIVDEQNVGSVLALSLNEAVAILNDAPKGLRAVKFVSVGRPLSEAFMAKLRSVIDPRLEMSF